MILSTVSPKFQSKYLLVPPDRRNHRAQMPEGMCIEHTPPGREIEQLQATGQNDPCDNQTRPGRPQATNLTVSGDGEPAPEDIVHEADGDIGGHVVGVIEVDEGQIAHMQEVQRSTDESPQPQNRAADVVTAAGTPRSIHAEDTYRRVE